MIFTQKIYSIIFYFSVVFLPNAILGHTANQQLFDAIEKHDISLAVDALNNGADVNTPQEHGYHYTPLMASLDSLHSLIVNNHDAKRLILLTSALAGAFGAGSTIAYVEKLNKKSLYSPFAQNTLKASGGLVSFAALAYACNKLLNYIFTGSYKTKLIHAYLIARILLEDQDVDVTAINSITGQNAHQMIGGYILNSSDDIHVCHPMCCWHMAECADSLIKKLVTLGILVSIEATLKIIDSNILKNNIESVFITLAQEIAVKTSKA